MTNLAKLRGMTAQEVAEFITEYNGRGTVLKCPANSAGRGAYCVKRQCDTCFREWLEQEAAE